MTNNIAKLIVFLDNPDTKIPEEQRTGYTLVPTPADQKRGQTRNDEVIKNHYKSMDDLIKDIDTFLEQGKCINTTDPKGNTLLHIAAKYGNAKLLQHLIKKGANINAANNNGNTPLNLAALNAHFGIAKRLITAGAEVNTKDKINGLSPLYTAIIKTTYLSKDTYTRTELHYFREIATLIIDEKGAVDSSNTIGGNSKLHLAAMSDTNLHSLDGRLTVRLLNRGEDISAPNNNNKNPLDLLLEGFQHHKIDNVASVLSGVDDKLGLLNKIDEMYKTERSSSCLTSVFGSRKSGNYKRVHNALIERISSMTPPTADAVEMTTPTAAAEITSKDNKAAEKTRDGVSATLQTAQAYSAANVKDIPVAVYLGTNTTAAKLR